MTEAEWVAADEREVYRAVAALSPRRQRLLAVAVCRELGRRVDYPAAHEALAAAETFADTGKTKAALRRARQAVRRTRIEMFYPSGGRGPVTDRGADLALFAVQCAATENAVFGTVSQAVQALARAEGIGEEKARRLIYPAYREVVGPWAVRVFPRPEWRTVTVVSLAEGMYESRDFKAMPVLADALEDAGCNWEEMLDHCRAGGPHVRGCWALDTVLGKG
jgi:hypothetical protein